MAALFTSAFAIAEINALCGGINSPGKATAQNVVADAYMMKHIRSTAEQQRNKRNVSKISWNGETHTLPEWADILGIKYGTLWKRLHDGMTIDEAFTK